LSHAELALRDIAAGHQVALEFPAGNVPSRGQSPRPAGFRVDFQRAPCRFGQVGVQRTGDPVVNDIDGAGDRKSRHRNAASHGFEIHQTEGIGAAGKNHDVGSGQMTCQILAELEACKSCIRIQAFEPHALRSIADDDLAAGPRHAQKSIDVLFDRHPADVGGNRTAHLQKAFGARPE